MTDWKKVMIKIGGIGLVAFGLRLGWGWIEEETVKIDNQIRGNEKGLSLREELAAKEAIIENLEDHPAAEVLVTEEELPLFVQRLEQIASQTGADLEILAVNIASLRTSEEPESAEIEIGSSPEQAVIEWVLKGQINDMLLWVERVENMEELAVINNLIIEPEGPIVAPTGLMVRGELSVGLR